MSIAYHELNVTPEAKIQAKEVIKQLHLNNSFYHSKGELAFWLNISVPSDYVAIAVYVQDLMDTKDFATVDEVVSNISHQMPEGLLTVKEKLI